MEHKRKCESGHDDASLERPVKLGKREKLDRLVKDASLRVSHILDCKMKDPSNVQTQETQHALVSKVIKVANDSIKTEGGIEPKWARHVRKACHVQFMFKRGKSSSIGDIILIGLKPNVDRADYLIRCFLQAVSDDASKMTILNSIM
jgi:hypothetical protein